MKTTTLIEMDGEGRLTLPEEARRELRLEGGARLALEVVGDALVLRPAADVPEEDAWAYAPEHVERVQRALAEGSGRQLSEAELERLIVEEQR
jgi:bifunctional DNA-binding transcriptional regulator/antitoxin component of YhaV-PrlF toxin-antitoxin module